MSRLVLVAGLIALAGCGGGDSTTTSPASGPLVTYERTGGVASMPVGLVIREDGGATVEAGGDPARESFEIDADELERLRSELDAAHLEDFEPSGVPTGCNDCYVYELTYDGTTISYDESEDVPRPLAALVAHLSGITDEHYPPEADEPPIVN